MSKGTKAAFAAASFRNQSAFLSLRGVLFLVKLSDSRCQHTYRSTSHCLKQFRDSV